MHYEFSFRISASTDMTLLKKMSCEYWNVDNNEKEFNMYDKNGELCIPENSKGNLVEGQVEFSLTKESRWKELQEEEDKHAKQAVFWLGFKDCFT